jgi:hypothetical protein
MEAAWNKMVQISGGTIHGSCGSWLTHLMYNGPQHKTNTPFGPAYTSSLLGKAPLTDFYGQMLQLMNVCDSTKMSFSFGKHCGVQWSILFD